jgi:hypothetical protein
MQVKLSLETVLCTDKLHNKQNDKDSSELK